VSWAVAYTGQDGEGLCVTYPTWASARETLRGFIDMVNPQYSEVTFHRLLDEARPEHAFHATDGVYSFAIETL
jgi:hypothetical protein